MLGRIIRWPVGFILWARSDKSASLWSEIAAAAVHIVLVFWGTLTFGVAGAGAAFAGLYLFHVALIYWLVKSRHDYSWKRSTGNILMFGTVSVLLAFATTFIGNIAWRLTLGTMVLVPVSLLCLRGLIERIGRARLREVLLRLRMRLKLAHA